MSGVIFYSVVAILVVIPMVSRDLLSRDIANLTDELYGYEKNMIEMVDEYKEGVRELEDNLSDKKDECGQ